MAKLAPIQERMRALKERPDEVNDVLRDGAEAARAIARRTLAEVRERLGLRA